MSHAEHAFAEVPAHLSLDPAAAAAEHESAIRLLVKGQGTIGFAIAEKVPFMVTISDPSWGRPAFRWTVGFEGLVLDERRGGEWRTLTTLAGYGLDPEPACHYWFSFDAHNRLLRYGKGEMRLHCKLGEYAVPKHEGDGPDPYAWMKEARTVELTAPVRGEIDVWRDPVTIEPPLRVVPHDRITMDDMAANHVTVPANLTPTCRTLYDNVAGELFQLENGTFPFAEAIKESIADKTGWCFQTLDHKANEFGVRDERMTYLRITLGQNQGDSPGIPFVMEIWPVGHYSPVHNHGGSEAVIKVLSGAITVDLYPMLSPHHTRAIASDTFRTGEVTWISARLNQFHKLTNNDPADPCITIQCYLYDDSNRTHWPYFDYLSKQEIGHFDPNSDIDYVSFKAKMKQEYEDRRKRPPTPPPSAG